MALKLLEGVDLFKMAQATFGTKEVTPEQLKYVMTMEVPSMYLLEHHSVKGHRLTFNVPDRVSAKAQSHRPWQIDIVNDKHPNKAIMKSRQLGLSEIGVAEMIWFADRYSEDAVKCLYAFPTYRQLDSFIQTRLNPVIHKGYYETILSPENDSIKSKQIRNSFLLFRSASKASSVEGVDVDYLSLDEYDRVSKMAEESAIESMSSSKFQWNRRWSTPTTPNYGIHDLFEHSDKKHYQHKCTHCNHWNKMNYANFEDGGNLLLLNPDGVHEDTREIEDGTWQYVCQKCGKPLDRWYNGEWVSDNPNAKDTSGYFISQMNAVWVSADDIKRKEITAKTKQTFHNYVVGEPYQDISLALQDRDVLDNSRVYLNSQLRNKGNYAQVTIGIDWGVRHWVTVMGRREDGLEDVIALANFKESSSMVGNSDADIKSIILFCHLFTPDLITADIGYNGNKVAKLIEEFGDRAFGVQVNPAKSNGAVHAIWNDKSQRVSIDKLTQNRIMLEKMKSHGLGFWREMDEGKRLFIEHWKNVVIRDEEDDDGEIEKIITRKGADHYAQSSVYANIAMSRIVDTLREQQNNFGYTTLTPDEAQNMNDVFNDMFRKK